MFAGIDHRAQVDRDNFVEGLGGDFGHAGVAAFDADADIVVKDVDTAPLFDAGVNGGFHLLFAGDVGGDRVGLAAVIPDLARGFLGRIQVPVDAQDQGPLAGE